MTDAVSVASVGAIRMRSELATMPDSNSNEAAADGELTDLERPSLKKKSKLDRKAAKLAMAESGEWMACKQFLAQKKRYCSLRRMEGSEYCFNHQPEGQGGGAGSTGAKRMPCPLDPSHTVAEHDVDKHVLRCNKAKKDAELQHNPCYRANTNSGSCSAEEAEEVMSFRRAIGQKHQPWAPVNPPPSASAGSVTSAAATPDSGAAVSTWERTDDSAADAAEIDDDDVEAAAAGAAKVGGRYLDAILAGSTAIVLRSLVSKIQTWIEAHAKPVADWRQQTLCIPQAEGILADARAAGGGVSKKGLLRHEIQQASIVSHMACAGLVPGIAPAAAATLASTSQFQHAECDSRSSAGNDAATSDGDNANKREDNGNVWFVEFGAGRGKLSLALDRVRPSSRIVLIDRASVKRKADTTLRREQREKGSNTVFERVRMDIAHLHLRGVHQLWNENTAAAGAGATSTLTAPDAAASSHADTLSVSTATPTRVVAMGKHLCGGATDLALRSLAQTFACGYGAGVAGDADGGGGCAASTGPAAVAGDSASVTSAAAPPPATSTTLLHGIAIATCCHHSCNWESYVGKAWWRDTLHGTPAEFEGCRVLTSWAIIGAGRPADEKAGQSNASNENAAVESISTDVDGAIVGGGDASASSYPMLPADLATRSPHLSTLEWERSLSRQERIAIGRACKRLIDAGRVNYLRRTFRPVGDGGTAGCSMVTAAGSSTTPAASTASGPAAPDARLVHYCSEDITPENCLLLATVK